MLKTFVEVWMRLLDFWEGTATEEVQEERLML